MKKLFVIIIPIVALAIFMTFFSFPDLFAMFYVPHFTFNENIYAWTANHKAICPWVSATWPPLYYYTIGLYLKIIESLKIFPTYLININSCPVFDLINDRIFLFFAKLPFLILHIASAWIFAQFFQKKKTLWFLFWLLNPIAIFINFMEGQFDSIPIFFLLLTFYFAIIKNNPYASAIALGIGGAYKHYPFLLLLPFCVILVKTLKSRIIFLVMAIIPYLLTIIPSFNADFLQSLTFSENQKMLEAGISIGEIHVSFYIVLYMLLLFKLFSEKNKNKDLLIPYSFLFSAIYFITSFWFVQRFLFLLPSLLLLARTRTNIFKLLPIISIMFFFYTFFMFPGLFDHSLFRPIFPLIHNVDYLKLPINIIQAFIYSIFTSLFLWMMYLGIRTSNKKEQIINNKIIILNVFPAVVYNLILIILLFYTNSV